MKPQTVSFLQEVQREVQERFQAQPPTLDWIVTWTTEGIRIEEYGGAQAHLAVLSDPDRWHISSPSLLRGRTFGSCPTPRSVARSMVEVAHASIEALVEKRLLAAEAAHRGAVALSAKATAERSLPATDAGVHRSVLGRGDGRIDLSLWGHGHRATICCWPDEACEAQKGLLLWLSEAAHLGHERPQRKADR